MDGQTSRLASRARGGKLLSAELAHARRPKSDRRAGAGGRGTHEVDGELPARLIITMYKCTERYRATSASVPSVHAAEMLEIAAGEVLQTLSEHCGDLPWRGGCFSLILLE